MTVAKGRLVVSAFGVHAGGGKVLLDALMSAAAERLGHAYLDSRYTGSVPETARITRVSPTVPARLRALRTVSAVAGAGDVLLCFNNLPPLRRSPARTVVFVQSAYFAGLTEGTVVTGALALRLRMERYLFRRGRHHADEAWVQTPTMSAALARRNPGLAVRVMPFSDEELPCAPLPPTPSATCRPLELFYPADASPHKNHERLFAAISLLHAEGFQVSLTVTLGKGELDRVAGGRNPHIVPLGPVSRAEVLARLRAADALVFPSLTESFGLPLLEAMAAGIPIIASERDYTRDVCIPAETFDPASPRSIADAIRRFGGAARRVIEPLTAGEFVAALLA